jgi:hypothetical protein
MEKKCLNSWEYKDHLIWKYSQGYVIEDTNGEYHTTFKEAQNKVDSKII